MSKRSIRWLAPLAAGALALTACGSSSKSGAGTSPTSPTTQAAATTTSGSGTSTASSSSFTASLQTTKLGKTLVNSQGMTLYAFKADAKGKSNCNTGCDTTWPPLKPSGAIKLGPGLDSEDFKVIMRNDGSQQVTDYGAPLYTYAGDSKPGDTNGDGLFNQWYAVGAEGKAASSGGGAATATTTAPAPTTTTGIPGY